MGVSILSVVYSIPVSQLPGYFDACFYSRASRLFSYSTLNLQISYTTLCMQSFRLVLRWGSGMVMNLFCLQAFYACSLHCIHEIKEHRTKGFAVTETLLPI